MGGPDQSPSAHYDGGFCFAFASRPEGRSCNLAKGFSEKFQAWRNLWSIFHDQNAATLRSRSIQIFNARHQILTTIGVTTFVVDYGCSAYLSVGMKAFPVSTRYTASELKLLDRTAKAAQMSRSELIHARSLGKVVTTHELADWADAELAKNSQRKIRRVSNAA
jgi:hypothetical protein